CTRDTARVRHTAPPRAPTAPDRPTLETPGPRAKPSGGRALGQPVDGCLIGVCQPVHSLWISLGDERARPSRRARTASPSCGQEITGGRLLRRTTVACGSFRLVGRLRSGCERVTLWRWRTGGGGTSRVARATGSAHHPHGRPG